MTSTELLSEIKRITEENIELVKKKFSHLSVEQKTWKPNEYSWNIQEVFSHLNEYARYYHDAFLTRISSTRFTEPRENFTSSPLGKSAWKSMKLGNAKNVKRKFKTPRLFNPTITKNLVTGNDIEQFREYQTQLFHIIDAAKNVNLRKVKIPISISKIIKLRLGDALLFVVYHNERHMQQALNIVSNPKFPKK
jgi:uncharacterized damage-inducible protein DinB